MLSLPSRWPNPIPAFPPYVVRTPHLHGASNETQSPALVCDRAEEQQGKEKEETFF